MHLSGGNLAPWRLDLNMRMLVAGHRALHYILVHETYQAFTIPKA
jgi:hypothetical protein